ncbi:MAG: hypothetical protein NVS3B20_24550 [Polyangiales bacterium]
MNLMTARTSLASRSRRFVKNCALGRTFTAVAAMAVAVATVTTATTTPARAEETSSITSNEGRPSALAVEINPASPIVGYWGATLEAMLGEHHALLLSGHYDYAPSSSQIVFSGGAGELGYRYYSGRSAMRGLYVGPSLLVGFYTANPAVGDRFTFRGFGGAVDVGYQEVFGHLVMGIGVGAQYTRVTENFEQVIGTPAVIAVGGLRPRLLLSIGYAF